MSRRECENKKFQLTSVQLPLHSSPLPHMLYQHTSNDYEKHSANQHRDHQERCLPVQHVLLIIHGVLKEQEDIFFLLLFTIDIVDYKGWSALSGAHI